MAFTPGGASATSASPSCSTGKDERHFLADQTDPAVLRVAAVCRYYSPAFAPKAVPAFYDLSGITEDPAAFETAVRIFVSRYRAMPADRAPTVVVGYDARGFVLGPPIALRLGLPFVLLRKAGKYKATCLSNLAQHSAFFSAALSSSDVVVGGAVPYTAPLA